MDQDMQENINKRQEKPRSEAQKIRKQVRIQTITYIVGAMGLVAGLAWNEAIKGLIEYFFKTGHNSLPAKFIYAILITLLVAVISMYLIRYKGEEENS